MRVLIEKSHQRGPYTGAPGERDYIAELCSNVDALTQGTPIQVTWIDGDLVPTDTAESIAARHPEVTRDYDAFIALHYDANIYGQTGGWFWDRAAASLTAAQDDKLGAIVQRRYSALPGVPAMTPQHRNANTRDYWLFRSTTAKTPGVIVELGVGAPGAPDHDWLRASIALIAQTVKDVCYEFGGVALPVPAPPPPVQDITVLTGVTPAGTSTLSEWAAIYRLEGPKAGIRSELALAQAMHETGRFTFTGTAKADWNNPAGLGVTGSPDVGNRFASKYDGVVAHLQHLLFYFTPDHTQYCTPPTLDQRHYAHKGLPNDIRQLDGKWAVPGVGYGDKILSLLPEARALLAT